MPESPECRILTDNLIATFQHQTLHHVEVVGGRYLKEPIAKFHQLMYPMPDVSFNCRGKFLFWTFDDERVFALTLGMTGSFSPQPAKHAAIKFQFDKGDLYFTDIRRFGTFRIFDDVELQAKLRTLGWDILREPVPANLIAMIRKHNHKTIAEVMLDQSVMSGSGNYLRSEAMYRARIHPLRRINTLSDAELTTIATQLQTVANEAYAVGGATIQSFKDMYGNTGKFYDRFQVYSRKVDPLGNPVKKLTAPDGRSVFVVEELQQ